MVNYSFLLKIFVSLKKVVSFGFSCHYVAGLIFVVVKNLNFYLFKRKTQCG